MRVINLNNGHTPFSPGGVFGGRTEYGECEKLIDALYRKIKALDPSIEIRLTNGTSGIREKANEMLFVFHKGTHLKNEINTGACVFVGSRADAKAQYEAYRILDSICSDGGLRYRGVHTVTDKSPFRAFLRYAPESAYLIKAGFIDNEEDNLLCDREFHRFAGKLSEIIVKIYKEKINEDNG